MKTRACVLHAKEDIRVEERDVGAVGPRQVLVKMGAAGICGSDIHYFWDGGIGTIRPTHQSYSVMKSPGPSRRSASK